MIRGMENLLIREQQNVDKNEVSKIQPEAQTGSSQGQVTSSFSPLRSIKFRLPLLIGTLLLGAIIATTWAAYREVKASAFEVGHERLRYVTQQLASLLQQSASNNTGKTYAAANDSTIRNYLRSPQSGPRSEVAAVLRQFLPPQDQNSIRVELWNANHALALTLPEGAPPMPANLETEFKQADSSPSFSAGGAIRPVEGKVIYPLIATVKNDLGQSIGYLVRWRQIAATAEARQQFMNLIGRQANLYIGNKQGDVWTNLVNLVSQPPVDVRLASGITSYQREGNDPVKALGSPINGTAWFLLVEFSDREMLVQANQFLRRMMVIGAILLGIGLAVALVLSRRITKPLHSFTQAAAAIAEGDYSRLVKVDTDDELGSLARAFNSMVIQVRDSRNKLEQKVQERTAKLEAANRELESFSYSVSHDLRAPLRAVAGFSRILCEEYEPQLPSEARQYLHRVEDNAQQMGRLIDDLLAFSRLGRQAIKRQPLALADLARTVLNELPGEQTGRQVEISIGDLPGCQADPALLKQVFVNLLSNALKFTRRREVAAIEISSYLMDDGNNTPVYFVKDNGVGFDLQYAHKLFGVFQRLHRTEEYEGTGVGLAIVQRVIHRHGGRVWANAEPGQGATFYFTVGEGTSD
jgi:signal transduction histidine kinase